MRLCIIAPDKERFTLFATANTPQFSLYFSETFQRQKRNSISLMSKANDKQIQAIRISDCERIIYFELEDAFTLAFQFFSAETNFFLLEHGTVQESFKKQPSLLNQPFVEDSQIPILSTLEQLTNDLDAFLHTLDYQSFIALSAKEQERQIPKKLIGFDTYLAREMLFRTRSSSPMLEPDALHQAFQEMFYELISPEPKVYFSDNEIWLSLIPPTHLPYLRAESFNSVNEAIQFYAQQLHQREHFTKQLFSLKKSLERLIEKTDAQIRTMSAQQTIDRAEMYETFGKLLLLHRNSTKGLTEIELENIFSQGERIKIRSMLPNPYRKMQKVILSALRNLASNAKLQKSVFRTFH